LIGVVVGATLTATLQHWFGRAADARRQAEVQRNQSYVDYLRAVAKAAHAQSADTGRMAVAEAADAKARIAVYGDGRVVAALAAFEDAGASLDNRHSVERFLDLVATMRGRRDDAARNDLRRSLFHGSEWASGVG
jgi:hypothetical protein